MNQIIKNTLIFACFIFTSCQPGSHETDNELQSSLYLNNRIPLIEKPYVQLPLGSIKPKGSLLPQHEIMRDGLTGNLDENIQW